MAIVSDKPQTTRRAIRGVASGPGWQLVLVDLPGVQRPRDALTERMQRRVERELADADGCLFVVSAEQGIGPGDRFIAGLLARRRGAGRWWRSTRPTAPTGRGSSPRCPAAAALGVADEMFPVCARTGAGVPRAGRALVGRCRPGPFYFGSRAALRPDAER